MKADPKVIREIERLYEEWNQELANSSLSKAYQGNFHSYVGKFIKWTKDDWDLRDAIPQPSQRGQ